METKKCPNCGAEIPSLAGYCPNCGIDLHKMETSSRTRNGSRTGGNSKYRNENQSSDGERNSRSTDDGDDSYRREDEERDYDSDGGRDDSRDRSTRDDRDYDRDYDTDRHYDTDDDDRDDMRYSSGNYGSDRGGGSRKLLPIFIILCAVLVVLICLVAAQIFHRSPDSETTVPETTTAAGSTEITTQATTAAQTAAQTTQAVTTTAAATTAATESAAESSSAAETTTEAQTESAATTESSTYSTANATDMVTTTDVNLRSGPGSENPIITVVPSGADIKVIRTEGSWYLIDYNGTQGYIYGKYALTEEELAERKSEEASREAESKKAAETTKKSSGTDDTSIFPNSSTEYLKKSDITSLSKRKLRLARNEIYARHGYIFQDSSLQSYFEGKSWYTAKTSDASKIESELNDYEIANIKLIYDYEEEKGYH